MYKFSRADIDLMDKILKHKKFDLDLNLMPRFYAMVKGEDLKAYCRVVRRDDKNLLDYLYMDNLSIEEIDFFYRSLNSVLEKEGTVYTNYYHEGYTVKTGGNPPYKIQIFKGSCCGH